MANIASRMSKTLMTLCHGQCKRYLSAAHLRETCLNELLNVSFTVSFYILNFHGRKRTKNYMSDDKPRIAEKRNVSRKSGKDKNVAFS
jgi:hypothetical protein